jgi:hypothetical protein
MKWAVQKKIKAEREKRDAKIREYASKHPDLSDTEIGNKFDVSAQIVWLAKQDKQ